MRHLAVYGERISKAPRTCLFCGQPLRGGRSKEHVLPEWLQTTSAQPPTAPLYTSGGRVEREQQTVDAYREGRVCTACNTGWMSNLETAARPVLVDLIDGRRAIGSLSESERDFVSRWHVKTALMLASSALEGPARRPRFYADVRAGRVPARMVVVGHQRPPVERFALPMEVGWLVNPGWVLPPPYTACDESRFKKLVPVSFKVTLWMRHITLTAAYWPDNTWELLRWRGMHEAVSASAASLRDYPWPAPPAPVLSIDLMELLHNRLAVRGKRST